MVTPKVSIIIPAYNAEVFIEASIKSVLEQRFQDFEIVIVNDGSIDGTAKIVKDFCLKDKRITLIEQPNLGHSSARNTGINNSIGELIVFLDADDLWHKDKLLLQVECFDKNLEVGLVSCLSQAIDIADKPMKWQLGTKLKGNVYKKLLAKDIVSGGSVALIRRKCFSEVGMFDESLKARADWDMWIRISKKYPVLTIPKILVGYRRTKKGVSRNYELMKKYGQIVLSKAFKNETSLDENYFSLCLAMDASAVAGLCVIDGEFDLGWKYIKKALKINSLFLFNDFKRFLLFLILILNRIFPINAFLNLNFNSKRTMI